MQCFERKAMYLKLYADAVSEIPRLEYDPGLLDEVLSDFGIDHWNTLTALDNGQLNDLVKCIKSVADVELTSAGGSNASQDSGGSKDPSKYALPRAISRSSRSPSQNMHS